MSAAAAPSRKPVARARVFKSGNDHVNKLLESGGYTILDNIVVDRLQKCLGPAEYQCLLILIRHTAGKQTNEAQVPIKIFLASSRLKEREIYNALGNLRNDRVISQSGWRYDEKLKAWRKEKNTGAVSTFQVNYDTLRTLKERKPGDVVKKKRNPDGSAIVAIETERAYCLNCHTVSPVVPMEHEELESSQGLLVQKLSPVQVDREGTRHILCRGRKGESTPAQECRGDGESPGSREAPGGAVTPADDCRGRSALEPLEKYLIGLIPHFGAPFPADFVHKVDKRLGGAPLALFVARCNLRKHKLTAWGLILKFADDAREAWSKYPQAQNAPAPEWVGGRNGKKNVMEQADDYLREWAAAGLLK